MKKRKITKKYRDKNFPLDKYEDITPIRKLERKLDRFNHIMELVRTVIPIMILLLNCIILLKIFNLI